MGSDSLNLLFNYLYIGIVFTETSSVHLLLHLEIRVVKLLDVTTIFRKRLLRLLSTVIYDLIFQRKKNFLQYRILLSLFLFLSSWFCYLYYFRFRYPRIRLQRRRYFLKVWVITTLPIESWKLRRPLSSNSESMCPSYLNVEFRDFFSSDDLTYIKTYFLFSY